MEKKLNSSYVGLRRDILNLIPKDISGPDILDVGCATGVNGRYLLENGVARSVTGFEFDAEMAQSAREFYKNVYQGDIESINITECIGEVEFDGVIFGDVLEHLRNPQAVLEEILRFVRPGGFCIISVPNMQHIEAIWRLAVNGYWPHNSRGIFDQTHLQIFTKKNLEELMRSVGLQQTEIHRNFRYRDPIGSRFPLFAYPARLLFPNLYTFQYIALSFKE